MPPRRLARDKLDAAAAARQHARRRRALQRSRTLEDNPCQHGDAMDTRRVSPTPEERAPRGGGGERVQERERRDGGTTDPDVARVMDEDEKQAAVDAALAAYREMKANFEEAERRSGGGQ